MKKITQLSMLLIALFFMNTNVSAQSGDFEFLFETDGDTEGFVPFNSSVFSVAGGVLTYTYGSNTAGIDINPPASSIYLDKANYPYMAIQLSAKPDTRIYMYCKTNDVGNWYKNKQNPDNYEFVVGGDNTLHDENIFYWDMAGPNFKTTALDDGLIQRMIFNIEDIALTSPTVDIKWIKTFASENAMYDYFDTLGVNDVANQSQTKIISGDNKIDIKKVDLNAKVQVFNLLGQSVHTSIAKSQDLSIDIATTGVYIVKITSKTSNSVITKKAIVN